MNDTLKLPVGIDDFKKIREAGFYYVDKTKLIEKLLQSWGEVTLFTRPRRFGKTLNMSMLKCFFEIGTDPALFDGLAISSNEQLCKEYKDDPDFCGWARMILGIGTEADALSHAPGTDGTMWEREDLRRILLEEMIQKIEVWQDKKVCIYWNFCYNKQE